MGSKKEEMDILKKKSIIASRRLVAEFSSGEKKEFNITITLPYIIDEQEYCCEVYSDDVGFEGVKKAYGVDAIDSIDYAIQTLDILLSTFSGGKILWPDGTSYIRISTDCKMSWSKATTQVF